MKGIAELFIVGVRDFRFNSELQAFLKEYPIAGIALFNSPHDDPHHIWKDRDVAVEAVYDFVRGVYSSPCAPRFLAVDQEGGRVRRLRPPFLNLPSAEVIENLFREKRASAIDLGEFYALAARQMAQTGIHLNFAPVCDVRYKDSHDVVGDRSFGPSAEAILPLVEIFCEAFEENEVHTTLKHFPGHGPTHFDSHEQVAVLSKTKKELLKTDTAIFKKACAWASAVMTAHIAFEDEPNRIFSLDPELLSEFRPLLPSRLAWITDDLLSMKAVSKLKPWIKAYDSAYDFILVCGNLEESAAAIDETIHHAETAVGQNFSRQQGLEERLKRSGEFFVKKTKLKAFNEWKKEILRLEKEGTSIVEKNWEVQ